MVKAKEGLKKAAEQQAAYQAIHVTEKKIKQVFYVFKKY